MTRVDRIIILSIVAVMFIVAVGGIALWAPGRAESSSGLEVDAHDQTLVIHGCRAEDSCSVDYTARGDWTITKKPAGSW